MIGRLSGTVADLGEIAILDVHGVGYEVYMPARDLANLTVGSPATLVIDTLVREDMIRLYGFSDAAGRDWFRLLQSVQGVGAKVALGVLSVLPPDQLATAIATGDRAAIERAPGVGKRVAERIATELKTKAPTAAMVIAPPSSGPVSAADDVLADAVSALVNLGYDGGAARAAVVAARTDKPEAGAAELIRAGLRRLSA
ncbi:Holliday junction branch migration protein RuvA [Acuticoccus sp. MNP-M23]|uniref:Holliday junction branch migration protein RuvA n=1 Tax=Acuticoccus sp. MNP-M23 TaxID=3072793 RepID=UPI00281651E9|nr:Holliday junction branch migration protein RuvA [Acuticoccus sp. MNP-M23]WMS44791.1 Holliday junction branch migration protein RuvA [Acuticoccus sp. MNP-M23]